MHYSSNPKKSGLIVQLLPMVLYNKYMRPDSIGYKKAAIGFVLSFIIIVIFVFSLHSYPVVSGDSIYYTATAINYKLGHGLINQLSPMFLVGDPSGMGRFLVSPPLFPLTLSWLMPAGTPQGAYLAMFVIYAATILLAGFIFIKLIVPDWQKANWYDIAVCAFSLFSLSAITIFYPGRPETLSRLLTVLALFGLLYHDKNWLFILFGAVFGLSVSTHPGPAILLAPLICMFFAFYHPAKRVWKLIFLSFGFSVIVFFFITQIFGYGFLPTVQGTLNQFSRLNSNLGPNEYLQSGRPSVIVNSFSLTKDTIFMIASNLTVSKSAAFQGLIITLSLIFSFLFYRRFRGKITSGILFGLFAIMMAGVLFFMIVYRQNLSYVFTLTPLFILAIAYYSTNLSGSRILKYIALLVLILSSLIFFYRLALFPFFIKSGMSLERARETFHSLSFEPNQKIGVDGTIWPISENYGQMYLWGDSEDVKYPTTTIIMREGLNGWTGLPKELSYCRISNDFFIREKPAILGITLSNTMPGYAFTAYDCSPENRDKVNPIE
ncbi:hypothetical protein D4R51_01490 [bacterium]|nr:MAG: hypothetical protein D4R51_01490 [bacterium]